MPSLQPIEAPNCNDGMHPAKTVSGGGSTSSAAASPTTQSPGANVGQTKPLVEVLPPGSVCAVFRAEVVNLPSVPSCGAHPDGVLISDTEGSDGEVDNDDATMQQGPPHRRGTLGSVVDLLAMLVRVVLTDSMPGGRVVGTSTTHVAIAWSAQHIRTCAATGAEEERPGAMACRAVRETLLRLCGDLVEGVDDWIRCDGDDALRLRVAVVTATASSPLVVVQPSVDGGGSHRSNAAFLMLPRNLRHSVMDQWPAWTVAELTVLPSDGGNPSCGSPAALSPTVFSSGSGSPMEAPTRLSFPVDDETPNSPGSPYGLSRVPSRAFSVDDLGADFGNCTLRLSRTPLRCESDAASSVVVVRLECTRDAALRHVLADDGPLSSQAHRLAALQSGIAARAQGVATQFRGCVRSAALFQEASSPTTDGGDASPCAILVVEVVVALPRVELTWRMCRYTEHCAEAVVALVEAAVSAFHAWVRASGRGSPGTQPDPQHPVSPVTAGGVSMFAGGCLLQGHVLQSAVVSGGRHRRPQIVVGGEVLYRATQLLHQARQAVCCAVVRGGAADADVLGDAPHATPTASPDAGSQRRLCSGVSTVCCICEPSIAHWLAHNSTSMELRQPPRHHPDGGVPPTAPYVCLVPHQPHSDWSGHRLDRLAIQLARRKLNSGAVRYLVGADDARRSIGVFLASHLHSQAAPAPATYCHVCLIVGPPHSGKTTLVLDCAMHLALLPTSVLVDGHGCRPHAVSLSAPGGAGRSPTSDAATSAVTAAAMAPLLLRVYVHLMLARRLSWEGGGAATQPMRQPPSVTNGTAPQTLSGLWEAMLRVMSEMRLAGETLTVLVDDLDHVEGDVYSVPLLHRLSAATQLMTVVVATTMVATPAALAHDDTALTALEGGWSPAMPLAAAHRMGGALVDGEQPPPLHTHVVRVALHDALQPASATTEHASDGLLLHVFQVVQQFVGTSLLREAVEHLSPMPQGPLSVHHPVPFCGGLRRLLEGIAVASSLSLTAIASIACHLKDRTLLLSMCQCLQQHDDAPTDGTGLGSETTAAADSAVVDGSDALLQARLEDLLAADQCHFFHNTLSEWLAVLSPMEANWVCAVACYVAALGSHCRSLPVHVAEGLFCAVCLPLGESLSDVVAPEDASMFLHDVLSKLQTAPAPPAVARPSNQELQPPANVSGCDNTSTPMPTGADADNVLRLLVRYDPSSGTLTLTAMFVARIVLRLMRHDVVVRCCESITLCPLYDRLPVSAKLWLACFLGVVEDRDLMRLVTAGLSDDGAPPTTLRRDAGRISEQRNVCHVLRRFGYASSTLHPSGFTPSAGAVAAPPHKRTHAPEIADAAKGSVAYERLLVSIEATERSRKRIRRAGLARGACSSIVMVPTRCPDVDICLDYLRNAWRLLDTVLLKVRRDQHARQQQPDHLHYHDPHDAHMTSPHPFPGRGMSTGSMFTDLSFASVVSTESTPAHHHGETGGSAEGDAALLGSAMGSYALTLREELFVAEQRLRATWRLCKTAMAPIEGHVALESVATVTPPSLAALRTAIGDMDRLIEQAIEGLDGGEDLLGMDVGMYRVPYQDLCSAVAQRFKEVAQASRTMPPNVLRRIKEQLAANVPCTALRSGLMGLLALLERLHTDRCALDDMEDLTKHARAQRLQDEAARCIHDAVGVATMFFVRVLSAASCLQCSGCNTAPLGGPAQDGHAPTQCPLHHGHHLHHAQLAARNKHNSAAHAVMDRRIRRRFLTDVSHRYLTSLSALGEHVRSNRSALAPDVMELLAALVTVFPTTTLGYVTEWCVGNVGDLRRENLLRAEIVIAPSSSPCGELLAAPDDPTAGAPAWAVAVPRVERIVDKAPTAPAPWKPKTRVRTLATAPPPSA